jgi:hypothetical protein
MFRASTFSLFVTFYCGDYIMEDVMNGASSMMRNVCKILSQNLKGRDHLGDQWRALVNVVTKPLSSIQGREFPDHVSGYQLFKRVLLFAVGNEFATEFLTHMLNTV